VALTTALAVRQRARQEPDGRYSVIAYNKSDANGGQYMHRPTFLASEAQRVPLETWGEGLNARVFGATLRHDETGVTIEVPPEGGEFDLVPGYWTVSSLTGQWTKKYHNGWSAGGIFAKVTYH
jgi:hypothetical protein